LGCTHHELPFGFTLTFGPEKRAGERALGEIDTRELRELQDQAAQSIAFDAFAAGVPDLLLVNHISLLAGAALGLSVRFDVPYRITSYGTDTAMLLRYPSHAAQFTEAARRAERLFAISSYVAQQVAAATSVGPVEVLGGAVDPTFFHPPVTPRVPGNRIAFVGRLVTEKGIWTLLDAFGQQWAASDLDVIGEGPLLNPIRNYLVDSPSGRRVHLHGYVAPERLSEVLERSELLVVPSTWQEPLGLVVLEAMACGIPALATAVGGIPEMIDHGVNGYLVPPGNAQALAEGINDILGNRSVLLSLRRGCNEREIPTYTDLAERMIA
jgi:1,4-alpha-glucan branching enzyme